MKRNEDLLSKIIWIMDRILLLWAVAAMITTLSLEIFWPAIVCFVLIFLTEVARIFQKARLSKLKDAQEIPTSKTVLELIALLAYAVLFFAMLYSLFKTYNHYKQFMH